MLFRASSTLYLITLLVQTAVGAESQKTPTMADLLLASTPGDWRPLDPENTLYVELPTGRVVIELAPDFAPQHDANRSLKVRTLTPCPCIHRLHRVHAAPACLTPGD